MGLIGIDEANNLIRLMGLIRLIGLISKKRKGASHHVKLLFFFI
jgi:hypothetical protein